MGKIDAAIQSTLKNENLSGSLILRDIEKLSHILPTWAYLEYRHTKLSHNGIEPLRNVA
jgi:hypothetical protein